MNVPRVHTTPIGLFAGRCSINTTNGNSDIRIGKTDHSASLGVAQIKSNRKYIGYSDIIIGYSDNLCTNSLSQKSLLSFQ